MFLFRFSAWFIFFWLCVIIHHYIKLLLVWHNIIGSLLYGLILDGFDIIDYLLIIQSCLVFISLRRCYRTAAILLSCICNWFEDKSYTNIMLQTLQHLALHTRRVSWTIESYHWAFTISRLWVFALCCRKLSDFTSCYLISWLYQTM